MLPFLKGATIGMAAMALLLHSDAARASMTVAMNVDQLTRAADRVVIARVGAVESRWDGTHHNVISDVELVVEESLKGEIPGNRRLRLVQVGGRAGDMTTTVPGQPSFSPGERAVLFLEGPPGSCRLVGLGQGKRSLRQDVAGQRWMADAGDRSSAVRLSPDGNFEHAGGENALPLSDLRVQVLAAALPAATTSGRKGKR
jgi:hypothetical protein